MNARDRFVCVLNFQSPGDRLPVVEWAPWWNLTIDRWIKEGLPSDLEMSLPASLGRALRYFELDELYCLSAAPISSACPQPAYHGAGILKDEADYEALLPLLYPDQAITRLCDEARSLKKRHDDGDLSIRLWLDGFFWFPRSLFGIENHFFAFYDQPLLMLRMNQDLTAFHQRTLDALLTILTPDMVGFAEDMSYNHGPMLSRELFHTFIRPYYLQIIPRLKAAGMKVFVDSDGQVHDLLPWLIECGIEGIYPLERQSGVDVAEIRSTYPHFLMLGGFDKRVMNRGESEIRTEFERLLPVMRSGGFIPSVDHQTPPDVSLADYRLYLRLFDEYAKEATSHHL
ncbi:MAG: uroporphyrinogen decarboxylase family protein [Bacillota bacterium]|nr:uroporphyrinogen decarboxylase family protein [Bacillota bacterium]